MKVLLLAIVLLLVTPTFTVNAQDTDGERIARLEETVYNHLVTKADLERARSDILIATKTDIANLKTDLEDKIANNGYITWAIIVVVSIFGGKARQLLRLEPVQE